MDTPPELNDAQYANPRKSVTFTNTSTQDGTVVKRPLLLRAATDHGPRRQSPSKQPRNEEELELRHGWEEQYDSDYLTMLGSVSVLRMIIPRTITANTTLDILYVLHRQAS